MTTVLIDDLRSFKNPVPDTIVFRTCNEAIEWLETLTPEDEVDQLWLDHDLGLVNGVKTDIMPFVQLLEEKLFFGTAPHIHQVILHTSNTVGRDSMYAALNHRVPTIKVDAAEYLISEG